MYKLVATAFVSLTLALTACGEKEDDNPFGPGAGPGGGGQDGGGDDGSGTGGGDDGGSGSGGGDDGMTGGDGGNTGGDGGTTGGGDGMTGDDGAGFIDKMDVGGGGGGGPYAPCPDGMCPGGGSCLTADPPNDSKSYCAPNCSPAGDPSGCPAPPDGDSTPICIDVGDQMGGNAMSYCALDCSAGQTCPAGKECLMDSDINGPITICV